MRRVGEDTCYAGALRVSMDGRLDLGGGGRTVAGPAPMRIARPEGAMFTVCVQGVMSVLIVV